MASIRIYEERLRRDHNLPSDFVFYSWACMPKDSERVIYYEFKGGCYPLVKTGKRAGKPNYRNGTGKRTFQITIPESEQWEADWVKETGKCVECHGEGKTMSRFGVNIPTEYRECHCCKGSGLTPTTILTGTVTDA
jgi:hypothetical protein